MFLPAAPLQPSPSVADCPVPVGSIDKQLFATSSERAMTTTEEDERAARAHLSKAVEPFRFSNHDNFWLYSARSVERSRRRASLGIYGLFGISGLSLFAFLPIPLFRTGFSLLGPCPVSSRWREVWLLTVSPGVLHTERLYSISVQNVVTKIGNGRSST